MQGITKGYKVTKKDLTCNSFQFEIGVEHSQSGELIMCSNGFHFCEKLSSCFNYYSFSKENRVFEVEAIGQVIANVDKSCTSKIKLIRELTWEEVLKQANEGCDNIGFGNTGDGNTGDRNTGDRNTGYRNTGNWNTGYSNTGNWNTGDRNTGDGNTGNWNTGNWNTGYSNTGDRNTGIFCTGEPETIKMFDKPSNWTESDFTNSKAYYLLSNYVDTKLWVPESRMSEEEKKQYPSYKTVEGYLKDIPYKEAFQNAWHNFSDENKKAFTSLPNFDANIFEVITGVKIN